MTEPIDRSVKAIAARLFAVAHIDIEDGTTGQKHYGYTLNVGNSQLERLWHCSGDRTHPDDAEYRAKGWDMADLYCDSHYATIDDDAALAFLVNARQDMQALLALLGHYVGLEGEPAPQPRPPAPSGGEETT